MNLKKYIDEEITFNEAIELTKLKGTKLMELFAVANEIREKYCGDEIDACTITNAKSGLCSENCKFCAQSSHYNTGIETYDLKDKDGNPSKQWTARSPEEIAKYENLVKQAIGFNSNRGDSVKIENIQFISEDFSDSDKILTSLERKKLVHALFKWALLGFSLALFFFIVIRPFMQWVTDSFQESVEGMLPRTIEELEELQSVDNSLPGMTAALPVLEQGLDPERAESELLKDRIMQIVNGDEEKAQSAFGMWLIRKEP